jgi:Ferritin-like
VASLAGFEIEEGGSIDTREELVLALAIACELEHSLLVQYLFAAYTLKKWGHEGATEAQIELIRRWERLVLRVAHDEMLHLATACKLSVAIGGAPHLNRPPLPLDADQPFPFAMKLQRFGREALERFIRFETPEDQAPEALGIAPDRPEYRFLGELYGQIDRAFEKLGDSVIVGPPAVLRAETWDLRRDIAAITTVEEARVAIELITQEGEGSSSARAGSHWDRFCRARDELAAELEEDSGFEPARAVVDNPVTKLTTQGTGTLLPPGPARELGELFNHVYTTVLLLIAQFYSPADETAEQRAAISAAVRRTMSAVVRPLAEKLTEIPLDKDGARAGAPFETYSLVELGISATARFSVLDERVTREAEECKRLAGALDDKRLRFLSENLRFLQRQLRTAAVRGDRPAYARV